MKEIVVLGGGTAGWLTALYLNQSLINVNIKVIESKEIGILGAGEGATPHLVLLLDYLQIPISEIIKDCDATIKNGIKFTNWKNKNDFFYHPFAANDLVGFNSSNIDKKGMHVHSSIISALSLDENINSVSFMQNISELNKVPFIFNQYNNKNPIFDYSHLATYSIHFNASKMANKLKQIGISRGIKVSEDTVKEIITDEDNNITGFLFENKQISKCDFVFDCSGFHRFIIGKHYRSKWKSHSDFLPVNRALPFFIEMDKEIPPYTEAIAMKYGWIWKIPLQSRYGCGYVFDSSLISEDMAAKEIEEYLGLVPEYPRKNKGSFEFSAGYYETPWVNNCIAVGLSAGFIEPLEATSIWVSIMSLEKILGGVEWLYLNNKKDRENFNEYFVKINNEVVDFVYFHYMSGRSDTDFWKKFSYNAAPDDLKNILNFLSYRPLNYSDSDGKIWSTLSWNLVAIGIEKFKKDVIKAYIEYSKTQVDELNNYNNRVNIINEMVLHCTDHNSFIKRFVK